MVCVTIWGGVGGYQMDKILSIADILDQEVNTCLIFDHTAVHLKNLSPGGLAGRSEHLPAHVHGPGVGGDAGGEHHGRDHRQQVRRGRGLDQRQALQLPRLRRE